MSRPIIEGLTDENGQLSSGVLPPGTYVVREINPPAGYTFSDKTKPERVIIVKGGEGKIIVKFDNIKLPELTIKKVDAVTGEPLAGFTFKVTLTDSTSVEPSTAVTDKDGLIIIKDLKPGTYTVQEIACPKEYILDTTPQNVKLEAGDKKTLLFENIKYPTLIVEKLNGVTYKPVPNTTFKIEYENPNGGIEMVGTFRTDSTGRITLPYVKAGWYIITETIPAPGMTLGSNPVTRLYLKAGDNSYLNTENGNGSTGNGNTTGVPNEHGVIIKGGSQYEVVGGVVNYEKNAIVVKKADANNGEMLDGATFELYRVSGEMSGSNGTLIATGTTDMSGVVVFAGLEAGYYVVKEVKAPQYYLIAETNTQQAVIKADGTSTVELIFRNYPYGSLLISKVDMQTGKPLANTRFKVVDGSGAVVGNTNGEYVTDVNGEVLIPNLKPGTYVVTEIEAPEGYVINTTPQTITIGTDGKTYKVTFANQPISTLIIKKLDTKTKEPLANAEFLVTTAKGDVVGTGNGYFKTDVTGTIQIPNLEKGSYVVKEVKAPEGYILENQTQTIEVDYGKTYTLEFYNKKLSGLQIVKVDSETKQPLKDAKFTVYKKNGEVLGHYTTDGDGLIIIPELETGWVKIVETKAPEGYIADETPVDVEITDNQFVKVTFENKKLTSLVIKKIDYNSGVPLSGAKFTVEKQNGEFVGEYITDNQGLITITEVMPDWYVIKEIKAPDGYLIDETPKTVEVKTNVPTVITFTNKKLTGLEIIKIDEQSNEPLNGAIFSIERQNGDFIGEFTTADKGVILVPELEPDWYVVKEIKAPAGYVLDQTPQTVEVKTNTPTIVKFTNKKLTGLEIIKIDEQSNEPLNGAIFSIERQNGEQIGEYTTADKGVILIPELTPDWYVVKEIKAPAGYVLDETPKTVEVKTDTPTIVKFTNKKLTGLEIIKIDEQSNEPLNGAIFSIERQNGEKIGEFTTADKGVILIPELTPDWYVVKEIKAPDSYLLDQTPKTVEVKTDKPTVVKFTNKKKSGFQIIKIDSKTGEPLSGAKFTVYKKSGDIVGEYTTDGNGVIIIDNLENGWYKIAETKAPDGYVISETPKDIELTGNEFLKVVFENSKMAGLEIKKIDSLTGEPLAGAKFTIEKQNGEKIYTNENGTEFVTDGQGFINIPNLEPDYYIVKEISAPSGYILDETPKTVEVKTNTPTVVTFANKKLTGLEIVKVDEQSNEPLNGAVFIVERQNGEQIGEYTTTDKGVILIPELTPDWYVVKEIKAPDSYLLDQTPKTVEVKTDKPTVVKFTNKKKSGFQIIKIDSKTGEPLSGAKFTVYKKSGDIVGEYTTDGNGVIIIDNLENGWYKIAETKAPDGYIISETPKDIELKGNEFLKVVFENSKMTGLEIKKIDSLTGVPLSGAKFTIEKQNGEKVYTNENGTEFVTDGQGFINIPNLEPDYYIVKEISAPSGYILDETPKTVEVKTNTPTVVTFANQPLAGLKIIKIDSVTRKPIEGVEFAISKMNGEKVENEFRGHTFKTDKTGQIYIPNLENGYYTVTETRAKEGYIMDSEPKTVLVESGKPTILEVENKPVGGLLIIKTDMMTGKPLEGVKFDVAKINGEKIGTYATDKNGRIYINSLQAGMYTVVETESLKGYELDSRMYEVEVKDGKQVTIEIKNKQLAGIKILKIDSITKEPIYNVEFMIFDQNGKVVGTFYSDNNGVVDLSAILVEGRYTIRETRPAQGYFRDDTPRTIEFISGKYTEIVWENTPEAGQIQVLKVSADDNEINGLEAGTALEGAIFEVTAYKSGNVVDRFITDYNGRGVSKPLPLGRYVVKEVQAPNYYKLSKKELDVTIEFATQIVKLEFANESANTGVSIDKVAPKEVVQNQEIRYDIKNVRNDSSVALTDFYYRDVLPTDAIRLEKIVTGTFNQSLRYKITATTNKGNTMVIADNLQTTQNNVIDCSNASLGLANDEFVTSFTVYFGNVKAGFSSVEEPKVYGRVLNKNLPNGYQFANKADIGGKLYGEWIIGNSTAVTKIYTSTNTELPKTGN